MKNRITSNIGLKIASLFFAFLLWLVVNNIENPSIPQPFYDVPVTILNTELITDSGQVYEVLDNTDVIDKVTIRAPRQVISSLSKENIVATANVSDLSSLDTITINLSVNAYSNEVTGITPSSDTIRLKIENKKSKTLALKTSTSGKPETGYLVGEIGTEQNQVKISGPESEINQVAKAVVDVDVSGFTSDIKTNAEIKLYDTEDNVIQSDNIVQNIKSIGVTVAIWQTADIPLSFKTTGTPAAGYRSTGEVTSEPAAVTVAGKGTAIKNLMQIEIPPEAIDITGKTGNYVTEIDIREYLPDNVFLADSSQARVMVTVPIQTEISKRMEILGEKVKVTNLPEGFQASISGLEESFIIEAIGLPADISGIQASAVTGEVDVQKWMEEQEMTEPEPGYYTVEVDFGLPENVTLLEPVTVTMHLSKMEESNE